MTTKKKALGSRCHGAEGTDPMKGINLMSNPTVTPHPRSIAADKNIKLKPYEESPGYTEHPIDVTPTLLEADWAEQNIADHATIIRPAKNKGYRRTRVWQGPDGAWWRDGGAIYLHRGQDGEYRFRIVLRRGANELDLAFLRRVIENAKGGAFLNAGWTSYTDANGQPAWQYTSSRFYLRAGQDPARVVDETRQLVVCTDPRCTQEVHAALGDDHAVDEIKTEKYSVSASRYVDHEHEDERYEVSVSCETGLTPAEAASFINDLQWITAAAQAANATIPDPVVKGIANPAMYYARRDHLAGNAIAPRELAA